MESNSLDDHYLCTDIERMERIALQVPLSKIRRPEWDVKTLREAGLLGIHTDTEIWKTVWSEEERLNYQSTPMFMVTGVKPDHFLNLPVVEGEKTEGFLEIGDGEFTLPATIIRGKNPGKTVLVTAGLHAGEYVGIQTLIELSKKLNPEKVNGQLVLVKVLNRQDFEKRAGSISWEDGKNLNRVFPGKKDGTRMERLAAAITESLIKKADYYIDLHSGDGFEQLHPYVYYVGVVDEKTAEKSLHMARHIGVKYVVRSTTATGGAYNYASSLGIPSILIERGGHSYWTWEEVEQDKRDVRHLVFHLQGKKCHGLKHYRQMLLENVVYEYAPYTGCWYPSKKPGEYFFKGEELGELKDYYGNLLYTSIATENGVVLYQTASLNIIEDGPMIAYAAITETLT